MQTLPRIDEVNRLEEKSSSRVLVPIDFSASTAEVLRFGKSLAEQSGAAINLLHVIQPDLRGTKRDERTNLVRGMRDAAFQELSKLIDVLWPDEINASITVREGEPSEAILDEARSSGAQYIVLGAHSMRGLGSGFQRRSLAEILRTAPCPVILVPDGEPVASEPAER